jgi:hypothetical protein
MAARRSYTPAPRPWSLEGLMAVHILSTAGSPLRAIADAVGRGRGDVDLALWALVGRQPDEALLHLNDPPAAEVLAFRGAVG